jgi:uncharacterized protein (TIGR02246 family)
MPVTDPNTMSRAFVDAVNASNMEALLNLYEPNAKYVTRSGTIVEGRDALRETFARLVAAKGRMHIENAYCVVNGDVALVRARWRFSGTGKDDKPVESHGESAEVLRRGPDGAWRYLIDHPFGAA